MLYTVSPGLGNTNLSLISQGVHNVVHNVGVDVSILFDVLGRCAQYNASLGRCVASR